MQYLAPATLNDKGKPASEIICSNVKELLEHQQYIFDTLWNKSIPAEEKIIEIEEGISSANFEVFQSPQRRNRTCLEYVKEVEKKKYL